MADATFGLRAVSGHTDGHCYIEGYIPAADGTATFIGDAVKMYGTHTAGQAGPAVIQAAAGNAIFGVIERFLPNYDTLSGAGWNYRTASTLRRCRIIMALPQIIWEVQADDAVVLAEMAGHHYDVVVGSGDTTTGMSGMELDIGTVGGSGQLYVIGASNTVGEEEVDTAAAGSNLLVTIGESTFTGTATGIS